MNDDLKKQVAQQCRVISHMATAIAQVHTDKAASIDLGYGGDDASFFDMVGRWTAERMEILGDILNGMDAVTEDDDWTHPIFEEAHRRWPSATRSMPSPQGTET